MQHERWIHNYGVFKHTGQFETGPNAQPWEWVEFLPSEESPNEDTIWIFREIQRTKEWIFLYDPLRWYCVALGIHSGQCFLQTWPSKKGPLSTSENEAWKLLYNGFASHVMEGVDPV